MPVIRTATQNPFPHRNANTFAHPRQQSRLTNEITAKAGCDQPQKLVLGPWKAQVKMPYRTKTLHARTFGGNKRKFTQRVQRTDSESHDHSNCLVSLYR